MDQVIAHFKHLTVLEWLLLPGSLLGYQTVIMNALQAHGYTKAESWCKKAGNFLSFLTDIISGILAKKQPENPGNPGKIGG